MIVFYVNILCMATVVIGDAQQNAGAAVANNNASKGLSGVASHTTTVNMRNNMTYHTVNDSGTVFSVQSSRAGNTTIAIHANGQVQNFDSRRILGGRAVKSDNRPYVVYLQLTMKSAKVHKYRGWLCGGVVVHKWYVLTSAACVEDAEHFYVVSGTHAHVDSFDYKSDECAAKNRRKVVWKCVPKNYQFDIEDSVKWSTNDIAVVKVEKKFKFGKKERGCSFAVEPIAYNNISRAPEKPKTKGFVAGWGSAGNFREGAYRRDNEQNKAPENSKCLMEAPVTIMDKKQCAKRWARKFRQIIKDYMICTKHQSPQLSEICNKKYANCTELEHDTSKEGAQSGDDGSGEKKGSGSKESKEGGGDKSSGETRRRGSVDVGRHLLNPDNPMARRMHIEGGFCENDHGGPLIVRYDNKDLVIGVISACKINPKTHACQGPFLYTSVFNNRQFISCAIYKDEEPKCRRVFRAGVDHDEYHIDWKNQDRGDNSDGGESD